MFPSDNIPVQYNEQSNISHSQYYVIVPSNCDMKMGSWTPFYPPFPQRCKKEEQIIPKIKELNLKIKQLQKELMNTLDENKKLQKQVKPKRRYSQRRKDLQKKYICPHQDCRNSYSSRIALRSHLKKKHDNTHE